MSGGVGGTKSTFGDQTTSRRRSAPSYVGLWGSSRSMLQRPREELMYMLAVGRAVAGVLCGRAECRDECVCGLMCVLMRSTGHGSTR